MRRRVGGVGVNAQRQRESVTGNLVCQYVDGVESVCVLFWKASWLRLREQCATRCRRFTWNIPRPGSTCLSRCVKMNKKKFDEGSQEATSACNPIKYSTSSLSVTSKIWGFFQRGLEVFYAQQRSKGAIYSALFINRWRRWGEKRWICYTLAQSDVRKWQSCCALSISAL